MRFLVALWVLAASACGFKIEPGAEPVDDAPPEDVLPVDTDRDGVIDDADNCQSVANALQRDWDRDGLGDVCDLCPHVDDPRDPDMDGDGVGNACDPNPFRPAEPDKRLLWTGFYDAAEIAAWTPSAGTWSIINGVLAQSDAMSPATGMSVPGVGPSTYRNVYVSTRVELTQLGPNPMFGFCSAYSNQTQYFCCEMGDVAGLFLQSRGRSIGGLETANRQLWPGTFAIGSTIDLVQTSPEVDVRNRCRAIQSSVVEVAGSARAAVVRSGPLALYTVRAAVAFHYLFVVRLGP